MIQQVTVKYCHPSNDWIGEVENYIHGAAYRYIHGIQPRRICKRYSVLCVCQEVNLVNVERM